MSGIAIKRCCCGECANGKYRRAFRCIDDAPTDYYALAESVDPAKFYLIDDGSNDVCVYFAGCFSVNPGATATVLSEYTTCDACLDARIPCFDCANAAKVKKIRVTFAGTGFPLRACDYDNIVTGSSAQGMHDGTYDLPFLFEFNGTCRYCKNFTVAMTASTPGYAPWGYAPGTSSIVSMSAVFGGGPGAGLDAFVRVNMYQEAQCPAGEQSIGVNSCYIFRYQVLNTPPDCIVGRSVAGTGAGGGAGTMTVDALLT